jgi:hypothetical protein
MRYHLDVASPTSAALTNIHHLFHQSLSLGTELKHDIEFSRAARQSKRNMSTYLLSLVPFITDSESEYTRQKAIEAYNKALEIRNGDSDIERVVEKKMQRMSDTNTNIIN